MTDNPTDPSVDWIKKPTLGSMSAALRASGTITDLFKLANDDEFKAAVATLSEDDRSKLRAAYKTVQTDLDGKVKLEQFDGQVVNVVGVDWWHSDRYDTEGVSIHIRTEAAPDKKHKALTSSAPVVTWANRLREVPTEAKPVRVIFAKVPVSDPKRAAAGHMIWSVKQMPPARGQGSESGVPF